MAWPCSRFQEPTLKSPTETCHHLHTVAFSTDNFSTFSLLNQMPQVARLKYCRLELTWSSTRIPGEDNGTPLQYSCLENPWMEEPGRLQSMGSLRVRCDWATSLSLSCIGERNGNPLQCSCLENPRDGGAWWAAVYGVTQSQTWLKWLSILWSQLHFKLIAMTALRQYS